MLQSLRHASPSPPSQHFRIWFNFANATGGDNLSSTISETRPSLWGPHFLWQKYCGVRRRRLEEVPENISTCIFGCKSHFLFPDNKAYWMLTWASYQRNNTLVWNESIKTVRGMFTDVWAGRDVINVDHCVDITLPVRTFHWSLSSITLRLDQLSLLFGGFVT